MEKINNNNELEIMRSQMASFKKQLEQQRDYQQPYYGRIDEEEILMD